MTELPDLTPGMSVCSFCECAVIGEGIPHGWHDLGEKTVTLGRTEFSQKLLACPGCQKH
jgi:hypothetical protein